MSRFSIRRAGRRGWLAGCVLLAGAAVGLTAQSANAAVAIVVDAQANRKPISPLIYGVAFAANSNQLADLNCPLHRSGGNNETRYNWQINAHNLDADWYFESYPDSSPAPGETADSFVANSKSGGSPANDHCSHDRLGAQTRAWPQHPLQLFGGQIRPANLHRPLSARRGQRHQQHQRQRLHHL